MGAAKHPPAPSRHLAAVAPLAGGAVRPSAGRQNRAESQQARRTTACSLRRRRSWRACDACAGLAACVLCVLVQLAGVAGKQAVAAQEAGVQQTYIRFRDVLQPPSAYFTPITPYYNLWRAPRLRGAHTSFCGVLSQRPRLTVCLCAGRNTTYRVIGLGVVRALFGALSQHSIPTKVIYLSQGVERPGFVFHRALVDHQCVCGKAAAAAR